MKSLGEKIADEIVAEEADIKRKLDSIKKTHELLRHAAAKIAKIPWPFADTRKLLKDLASHLDGCAKENVQQLQEQLDKHLAVAAKSYEQEFVNALMSKASKLNVPAGCVSEDYFLGPFRLTLNFAEESAVLSYAGQPVAPATMLDPDKLVSAASELTRTLLAAPSDVAKLANDFDEAIRVSLARSRKPTVARELRCPLPDLYREMTLLRQDRTRPITNSTFRDYPNARFVVEVKTLVQSEENLAGARRFRLETAVIENTKNSKKSVFIPTDLERGFSEGTYYQALILVNES